MRRKRSFQCCKCRSCEAIITRCQCCGFCILEGTQKNLVSEGDVLNATSTTCTHYHEIGNLDRGGTFYAENSVTLRVGQKRRAVGEWFPKGLEWSPVGIPMCPHLGPFWSLTTSIERFEDRHLHLTFGLRTIKDIMQIHLGEVSGETGREAEKKMEVVLGEHSGFQTLLDIRSFLDGADGASCALQPNFILLFKFSPITSVHVVRSFSVYHCIPSDSRMLLTEENIATIIVSYCNSWNDPQNCLCWYYGFMYNWTYM